MGRDFESQLREIEDHYRKYDESWRMKPGERKGALGYLLLDYSATDICDAITGMFLSDFHQGRSNSKEVWIGFSYVFREHNFDKFRGLALRAAEDARLKIRQDEERSEADRIMEEDKESMKRRHLDGFRYAHRPSGDEGGVVE